MFRNGTFFRTAHDANLKHVSGWHTFQHGTQHMQRVVPQFIQLQSLSDGKGCSTFVGRKKEVGVVYHQCPCQQKIASLSASPTPSPVSRKQNSYYFINTPISSSSFKFIYSHKNNTSKTSANNKNLRRSM